MEADERFETAALHLCEVVNGGRLDYSTEPRALRFLRLYRSFPFRCAYVACAITILTVGVWEAPENSLRASTILHSLELCCYTCFAFELWVRAQTIPHIFLTGNDAQYPWTVIELALLPLMTLDCLQSWLFGGWQLLRCLRPFFLLQWHWRTRSALWCVGQAFLGALDALLLLAFVLFIWAVGGVVLFRRSVEGSAQLGLFDTLPHALHSLFILLTTANNPDVWMPAYHAHRLFCLFFISWLGVSLYLLLSLVLASVYNRYRSGLQADYLMFHQQRQRCLGRVFDLLVLDAESPSNSPVLKTKSGSTPRAEFLRESDLVPLLARFRQEWGHDQCALVARNLMGGPLRVLPRAQFLALGPALAAIFKEQELAQPLPITRRLLPVGFFRYSGAAARVVGTGMFAAVYWLLILFRGATAFLEPDGGLLAVEALCIVAYTLEVCLKAYACGGRKFLQTYWNRMDLIITTCSVASLLASLISNRTDAFLTALLMLRVARLFRLISPFESFHRIIATTMAVSPSLSSLLIIMVATYYSYAVVGMALFRGVLQNPAVASTGDPDWDPTNQNGNYYPLNFDTLPSAFVVLFNLMVVNNWYELLDAYRRATGPWAIVYFVCWYVAMVLVVLNVLTSFVIDAYVSQTAEGGQTDDSASSPVVPPAESQLQSPPAATLRREKRGSSFTEGSPKSPAGRNRSPSFPASPTTAVASSLPARFRNHRHASVTGKLFAPALQPEAVSPTGHGLPPSPKAVVPPVLRLASEGTPLLGPH
eukprot:TRINITY_DN6693_c0_g1_i1.p1 TRINITY_DN6693_c0_g1~~TRINITY_DN6693_c0_g1_i1.p1  ORF type:complete len:776 (+),score=86.95 TRINITY_DN6693_c0_g1_i1:42-2330(+)